MHHGKRFAVVIRLAVGIALAAATSQAHASTVWTNALADGDINNAANWSAGLPDDTAGLGIIVAGTPLVINQVFDNSAGGSGDDRSEFLISGAAGTTIQAGANLTYLGDGLIGSTAAGAGGASVVTQTGGTITQDGGGTGLLIGHNAMGTWNLSGGSMTYSGGGATVVGHSAGSAGSLLNVTGGLADLQTTLTIGQGGSGTVAVSGTGDVDVAGQVFVGNGSVGQLDQSGGTFSAGGSVWVGNATLATATQTGGGFNTNGSLVISRVAGAAGSSYSFGGGTFTVTGDLRVGLAASGTLELDGSGGTVANLGNNLTFDRDDSTLAVTIDSPTAFTALNAGTVSGSIMMIKTDAGGVTGADLDVTLDIDLAPGSYQWTIINLVPAGVYGVSGVYFEDNVGAGAGPVGYFNGLADDTTFSVFSTPTNTEYTFRIDYDGGSGNDLVLSTVVTVVPTPAALTAGLMLIGLASMRRRR